MTAKEYLKSLSEPFGSIVYDDLTEQECLDKLIESHKRIKGKYVYTLEEPMKQINDSFKKLIREINKL